MMAERVNPQDSTQLDNLRRLMRLRCVKWAYLTPLRMGRFAAERCIVVTDFGAHSKRWIRLFEQGRCGL